MPSCENWVMFAILDEGSKRVKDPLMAIPKMLRTSTCFKLICSRWKPLFVGSRESKLHEHEISLKYYWRPDDWIIYMLFILGVSMFACQNPCNSGKIVLFKEGPLFLTFPIHCYIVHHRLTNSGLPVCFHRKPKATMSLVRARATKRIHTRQSNFKRSFKMEPVGFWKTPTRLMQRLHSSVVLSKFSWTLSRPSWQQFPV